MMFLNPCGAVFKAYVVLVLGFSSIASTLAAPVALLTVKAADLKVRSISDNAIFPRDGTGTREPFSSDSSTHALQMTAKFHEDLSVKFHGDNYRKAGITLFERLVKGFAREHFKVDASWVADNVTIQGLKDIKPSGNEKYTCDLSGFTGAKVTARASVFSCTMELVESKRPKPGAKRTLSYNGIIKDKDGQVVYEAKFGVKVDHNKDAADATKDLSSGTPTKAEGPSATKPSTSTSSSIVITTSSKA
ncbi:hypothetical protein HHX47_DHR10000007 [Lentinula edodes]|nr:hypothetical protein HHX47_DHR10000007 [Lentinula edodes]